MVAGRTKELESACLGTACDCHERTCQCAKLVRGWPEQGNDILEFVELDAEAAKMPILKGIVNLEETIDGGWRGLLVSILHISEGNVVSAIHAFSNEGAETG